MVVDQTVQVGAILVVGSGMEQNIQPTALTGGDRDYRDAQHLRQTVQVDLHAPLFYNVHTETTPDVRKAAAVQAQKELTDCMQAWGVSLLETPVPEQMKYDSLAEAASHLMQVLNDPESITG